MNNYFLGFYGFFRYLIRSFSQEGEDKILDKYFRKKKKGFFVDVGAHHPFRFSNTYIFYKKGWRGINIDATPGSMKLFNKYRPGDTNLETPISNNHKKLNYYIFDEPALNSFSRKLSEERASNSKYKIIKIIKLKPSKLSEVLSRKMPLKTKIDFMSIDVEGSEYEVLASNDWDKFRPEILLVEILSDGRSMAKNKVYKFIKKKRYCILGRTGRTVIFKRNSK